MLRTATALTALLMVTAAHADDQSDLMTKAQAAITAKLNDPDSAKFSDLKVVESNGTVWVCGRVNAKNKMGGYDGPKPFAFNTRDKTPKYASVIYGGSAITDDTLSGMAQLKGYTDVCG